MPFNSFLNYPMSWKPERSRLKRPIYLSLADQLEQDIAAGFLSPGTKLPPQRELVYLPIHTREAPLSGVSATIPRRLPTTEEDYMGQKGNYF